MESEKHKKMIDLLDHHHNWPDTFVFKFIFKTDTKIEESLRNLFSNNSEVLTKSSKKKNYSSMTVKHVASSSVEVMDIYDQASKIEGVMSL